MFTIFSAAIVCAFARIFGVLAGPTQISVAEKTFRDDANFQNVHFTLMSIENKLRNLENTLSVKCVTVIDGKIDYYGKKIDNIEKDLSRFQVFMRMELDKISENISSRNFKDDVTKDRIARKIDAIYERISHKLGNIEGQIDIAGIKSQNAGQMIMSKIEKMEETLTIRDADMEAELADAVAAIDDLKATYPSMEENILNVTKESINILAKTSEKAAKKQHIQTMNALEGINKSLSENVANLGKAINFMLNQTNDHLTMAKQTTYELDENLNEYTNKITDMCSDLWKKTDSMENSFQNLGKVVNLTRSEQQNGLRALMVQVGRKSHKPSDQSDFSIETQKLADLSQKMDLNFEKVMQAQDLFLESCHRVQMDEPQLESQISMILHQLIDIFEKKVSVEPKDIQKLEYMIHAHDSAIRENIYQIINALLASKQETTNVKVEIINYINNQKVQLEAVYTLLRDVLNFNDSRMQNIGETLQSIQLQLNEIHTRMHQANLTHVFINQLLEAPFHAVTISNNAKWQQTLEFIQQMYDTLTNIDTKISKSYIEHLFNERKIKAVANCSDQHLNKSQNNSITEKIPELILQIFGGDVNRRQSSADPHDYRYTKGTNVTLNLNIGREETEDIILICKNANASVICDKINNSKYYLIKQNETVTDDIKHQNLTNLDFHNLNESISFLPTKNLTNNNCSSDYGNLIDVRSGDSTSNCNESSANFTNPGDEYTKSYEIDVRYEIPSETTYNPQLVEDNFNGTDFIDSTTQSTHFAEETIANDDTTSTSRTESDQFIERITSTEKWDINTTVETYRGISVTEEDEQISDENYAVNSEDDSTELHNDFEYTDHQYL